MALPLSPQQRAILQAAASRFHAAAATVGQTGMGLSDPTLPATGSVGSYTTVPGPGVGVYTPVKQPPNRVGVYTTVPGGSLPGGAVVPTPPPPARIAIPQANLGVLDASGNPIQLGITNVGSGGKGWLPKVKVTAPKGGAGGGGGGGRQTQATQPPPAQTTSLDYGIPLVNPNQFQGLDQKSLTALTRQVLGALNIPYGQLTKAATAAAKSAVAQNVAQLVAQQQAIRAEGQRVANTYLAGGQALAGLNAALPGILRSNYTTAAQVMQGLAGGYAGDVAQTAAAQAGGVTGLPQGSTLGQTGWGENFAGVGPGTAATSLQNAVYGLGGAIPASGYLAGGQGGALQAQAMQQLGIGQGNAGAVMAQAQAATNALKLLPDIEAQQAKLPSLISSNLNTLASQYQKSGSATAKALMDLAKTWGLTPYQAEQLQLKAVQGNQTALYHTGTLNVNAAKAASIANAAQAKLTGPKYHFYQDSTGLTKYMDMNPQSPTFGQGGTLPGTPKTKAGKSFTPNELNTIYAKVQGAVSDAATGTWYAPTQSAGQASQLPNKQPVGPDKIWTQMLQAHPQIFANPAARQLLLDEINSAYSGTSLQIAPGQTHPYPQLALRNGRLYYQGGGFGPNKWVLATDAPIMGTPPIAGAATPTG